MYNLYFTVIVLTFSFTLNGDVFVKSMVRDISLAGSKNNQYVSVAKQIKARVEPIHLVSMHKWMLKVGNDKSVCATNTTSAINKKNSNQQTPKKLPKSDISIYNRLRSLNSMPIIDELSPPLKKTRLM